MSTINSSNGEVVRLRTQTSKSCAKATERQKQQLLLRCSGDLVSRLSNGSYGASYGLLWWLIGDTKWTY